LTSRGLFTSLFAPEAVADAVSDRAWLQAMLDVEAALAAAEADVGLIPPDAASAIAAACDASRFDPGELGIAGRSSGNPVVPLVRALREAAGEWVHFGATSQDVLDSAAMLVSRRALVPVLAEVDGVAAACARLAREHRETPMAGRTLLQQAVPVTFGLKAAGWLAGVKEAAARLRAVPLAAQLGGPAGTLAGLSDRGPAVLAAFAARLDLDEPPLPWHGARGRVADLGAALAIAAGVAEKIALDIVLLAQTEVAEVSEVGGESSSMPHKRNPASAVRARAAARSVRAAAGVLLEAMAGEHERAAGAWHSEWTALTDALAGTGGAAWAVRESLAGLTVHPDRMRANMAVPPEGVGAADEFIDRALRGQTPSFRGQSPQHRLLRGLTPSHRVEGPAGAPVVVFSSSLGTTLEMWDPQVAALAGRFRVVRYDHRGHGSSPVPPGPYTIEELAGDALALLDRLGTERVTWCGLSLGGMVGMSLALRAPERFERLVLCCTSAHLGPPEMWAERAATARGQGIGPLAPAALGRWFTPTAADDTVARFDAMLRATPPDGYAAGCEAIAGHDLRGRLGAIRAPTLVIAADDDPSTPLPHLAAIRDEIPGARLEVIEHARHLVNVERPEAFTRALLGFLEEEDK
jgi:3-carboxy-cis,cis-muconate cycloisomerase